MGSAPMGPDVHTEFLAMISDRLIKMAYSISRLLYFGNVQFTCFLATKWRSTCSRTDACIPHESAHAVPPVINSTAPRPARHESRQDTPPPPSVPTPE